MKPYFFILFACVLVVGACKKDRTCNCTIITNGVTTTHTQTAGFEPIISASDTTTSTPLYEVNTLKRTYHKVTNGDMRSNCLSKSEESVNQTSTSNTAGIFSVTTTQSGIKTTTCKIE